MYFCNGHLAPVVSGLDDFGFPEFIDFMFYFPFFLGGGGIFNHMKVLLSTETIIN